MARLKILLLPGLDGDGFYLSALREMLSQQYPCEVLTYPKTRQSYEDLCAFACDRLDFDSHYVIFAESYGGPLAIRMAEVLEAQVRGMVFCATFCEPPTYRFLLAVAAAVYPRVVHLKWMQQILNFLLFNGEDRLLAERLQQVLSMIPPHVIAHRISSLRTLDMRAAGASLTVPCLVINARRDRLVRFRRFSHLSNAQFLTLDGPHELGGTRPKAVADAISGFINASI